MDGMSPREFERKLKRLNPSLWVDYEKIAYPYLQEYPTCGLYDGDKFVMGVPNKFVPKWSIAGADLERMLKNGEEEKVRCLLDKGCLPDDGPVDDRIMWRGYVSILAHLCRQGLIERQRAQEIFRCDIHPNRMSYPKNYIQFKPK